MNRKVLFGLAAFGAAFVLGLALEARLDILGPRESDGVMEGVMRDEEKIKQVLANFVSAWNANDAEKAALVYTDPHYDVNATPQRETRADTVEKFRKYYDAFETTVEVTSDEIIVFGDQAVQKGEFILTSTPRQGGETEIYTRRYIEVLRKDRDGNWAVYWGIDGPLAGQ